MRQPQNSMLFLKRRRLALSSLVMGSTSHQIDEVALQALVPLLGGQQLAALPIQGTAELGDVELGEYVRLSVGHDLVVHPHAVQHPGQGPGIGDLHPQALAAGGLQLPGGQLLDDAPPVDKAVVGGQLGQIGRASWRERVLPPV